MSSDHVAVRVSSSRSCLLMHKSTICTVDYSHHMPSAQLILLHDPIRQWLTYILVQLHVASSAQFQLYQCVLTVTCHRVTEFLLDTAIILHFVRPLIFRVASEYEMKTSCMHPWLKGDRESWLCHLSREGLSQLEQMLGSMTLQPRCSVAYTWVNGPYMLPLRTEFCCHLMANLGSGMQ